MLKTCNTPNRVYLIFTILLMNTLITQTIIISESEQIRLEDSVRDALKSSLEYLRSNVDEDGLALGYGENDILKATARLGVLAGYIHLGLSDDESLIILKKIANVLTKLSDNLEDKINDRNERILVEQALIEFAVIHYGLTGLENSKNILLRSCRYLEENIGWSPPTACPTYLIYSTYISYIAGGKINRNDVKASLEEIKQEYIEFVNYTAWGGRNLAYGLEILSLGLRSASLSNVNPPVEVVALWEVHLNHTLQYVEQASEQLTTDEAEAFLSSLVSALEAPYPTKLKAEAINVSEELAGKLLENWMVGGRLIMQNRYSLSYLMYDPTLNYSELLTLLNKFPRIKVYDLNLPLILERLSKIDEVENRDKYRELSSSAVAIVSSSKPYFKVISEEIMPKQDIVDYIVSTSFLATWYSFQKLRAAPPTELTSLFSGPSYVTLISCSILLLALLIMYRLGKLIKEEE
jgi:hypothetical protein